MTNESHKLLYECLSGVSFGWENLVDRLLPQVTKVVEFCMVESGHSPENSTLKQRLVHEIFQRLQESDFRLLRDFDGTSELSTYISVISQRVARDLLTEELSSRQS